MQELPSLAPYPHLPASTARSPVLSALTYGYRPDSIEGGSPDCLTQDSSRKQRIMHLDPLQKRSANGELRQIQEAQVSTQLAQQCQHVRRSVALGVMCPCALLVQQREQ